MPEVKKLYCDAPDCDEEGGWVTIGVDGVTYEVILGPRHIQPMREAASWGQRVTTPRQPKRPRRGTEESRLLGLIEG